MSAGETPGVVVKGASDPLIGRVLGNYVIKRRLTEGGMGAVYIAEHEKLGHLAAVKVLKREMAVDDEWSRRFLTEAQAGARLQSPNLVRVIDFGKMEDGYDYMAFDCNRANPSSKTGVLYVGTVNGRVMSIIVDSPRLLDTPDAWPKYQRSMGNSGNTDSIPSGKFPTNWPACQ